MFGLRKRVRELESRVEWLEKLRREDRDHIFRFELAVGRLANIAGYRAVHVPEEHRSARIDFEKIPPGHRDG